MSTQEQNYKVEYADGVAVSVKEERVDTEELLTEKTVEIPITLHQEHNIKSECTAVSVKEETVDAEQLGAEWGPQYGIDIEEADVKVESTKVSSAGAGHSHTGHRPRLTRISIFEVWRSSPSKHRIQRVYDFVKTFYNIQDDKEAESISLKKIVKTECEKIRQKWVLKQRRLDLFLKFYQSWLCEDLDVSSPMWTINKAGHPAKTFRECSSESKRRKVGDLITSYVQDELTYAAAVSVRASGRRDRANLIQDMSIASPRRATSYEKAKKQIFTTPTQNPYSPEEALALFIANKFTVLQYKNIQQEASERGFNLYPSYDRVLEENENC